MHRVTISLEEGLACEFDRYLKVRGYQNRSEAVRDLLREALGEHRTSVVPDGACVATLSYVYNHQVRSLAQRLRSMQHERHDLIIAATHVPLDHDHCLETLILKGPIGKVQLFSDGVQAERGVRFGSLNMVGVARHDHHGPTRPHRHEGHAHLSPLPG